MNSKKALILLILILLVGALGFQRVQFGSSQYTASIAYSVILEHHGIPGPQMEKEITIPLERALGSLSGVQNLQSNSELGQSRINVTLKPGTDEKVFFIDMRDRVYQIYSQLPPSVQKPRIFSNTGSQNPSFLISFSQQGLNLVDQRSYLEKAVKPLFESINGIGEVRLYGGTIPEIHFEFLNSKNTQSGISPQKIGQFLQSNHILEPLGELETDQGSFSVLVDGHFKNLEEIRKGWFLSDQEKPIQVGEAALVKWSSREQDNISRVSDAEGITLALFLSASGNPILISGEIKNRLGSAELLSWDTEILLDEGRNVAESLTQILVALVLAIVALSLLFIHFFRNALLIFTFFGFFITSIFLTLGLLGFLKITVTSEILAGITLGIGLIADNGILGIESIQGRSSPHSMTSSLVAANVTTVLALVPLFFIGSIIPGLVPLLISLTILMTISLVLVLLFFHPLIPIEKSLPQIKLSAPDLQRFWNKKKSGRILFSLLTLIPIVILFVIPKSFQESPNPGVLFARVEFPSGTSLNKVNDDFQIFMNRVSKLPHLDKFESTVRKEQASFTVTYDAGQFSGLSIKNLLQELQPLLGQGQLIFIESNFKDRIQVEIGVYGDDLEMIHNIARDALGRLTKEKWILGGVYHFKPNPKSITFVPTRNLRSSQQATPAKISELLRWSLQGPVLDKIFINDKETDIRIFGENSKLWSQKELEALRFPTQNDSLPLSSLGNFTEAEDFIRITRRNGQRVALFSIEAQKMDISTLEQKLREVIKTISMPKGFSIILDPKIFRFYEDLNTLIFAFVTVLVLIYFVLAAQKESLTVPLLILFLIPASLLGPLLYFFFMGFINPAGVIGLIMVTGTVINNGIVVMDYYPNIREGIRSRFFSLFLTTLTTVIGCLPIIVFGPKEDSFEKTLAWTILLGILGSFFVAVGLLPFLNSPTTEPRLPAQERSAALRS